MQATRGLTLHVYSEVLSDTLSELQPFTFQIPKPTVPSIYVKALLQIRNMIACTSTPVTDRLRKAAFEAICPFHHYSPLSVSSLLLPNPVDLLS